MTLSNDNFAKWIFLQGLKIKNYNYDLFYDINRIQEDSKANRNILDYPIYRKYTIFFRKLGSDLCYESEDKESKRLLLQMNDKAYDLIFCFNYNRFNNIPFVEIKKIK